MIWVVNTQFSLWVAKYLFNKLSIYLNYLSLYLSIWYTFIHLDEESHYESKVSCQRTQSIWSPRHLASGHRPPPPPPLPPMLVYIASRWLHVQRPPEKVSFKEDDDDDDDDDNYTRDHHHRHDVMFYFWIFYAIETMLEVALEWSKATFQDSDSPDR